MANPYQPSSFDDVASKTPPPGSERALYYVLRTVIGATGLLWAVQDLGQTTTAAAKAAEHSRTAESFRNTGFIPLGNLKSVFSMKISISQVYIEPGAEFPFSRKFQVFLTKQLTQCTPVSEAFAQAYGEEWNIIIRVSAKRGLNQIELPGPTVFKRNKDDRVQEHTNNQLGSVIRQMFDGVVEVLRLLRLDSSGFEVNAESLIDHILSDSSMFEQRPRPLSG